MVIMTSDEEARIRFTYRVFAHGVDSLGVKDAPAAVKEQALREIEEMNLADRCITSFEFRQLYFQQFLAILVVSKGVRQ